jgi:Rap1a immunity proteins
MAAHLMPSTRLPLLTYCLAIAVALFVGPAHAMAPSELLQSCASIAKVSKPSRSNQIDIPAAGLPCWYFMSAVQNMSVLTGERGDRLLGICAPPESSVLDYVQIFVRAVHRKSSGANDNAAAQVVAALAESYPCPSPK